MSRGTDVLIVGGGVVGLGIAWRLAQRGASVTVIDRGPMAGEASSHAAGMLVPLAEAQGPGAFLDLCLASLRKYPAFAEELLAATGVDIELGRAGTLHVALGKEGADALTRSFAWLQTLPFNVERLDAAGARAREPNVTPPGDRRPSRAFGRVGDAAEAHPGADPGGGRRQRSAAP